MQYFCAYSSPLGGMTLASDGEALIGLWFDGQKHFGSTIAGDTVFSMIPVFMRTTEWLDAYFCGGKPDFLPPVRLIGTHFQQTVWRELQAIPYGHTMTYGALAARIGNPSAVRAVGGAVGRNPISLIVPCHRITGANGKLTGYAGGLDRKRWLLDWEQGKSES